MGTPMNNQIARQRCKHHPEREASVRCPACGYFYCSECCAEHDGRLLCSACLASLTAHSSSSHRSWVRRAALVAGSLGGFLLAWFLFFFLGDALLSVPDSWFDVKAPTSAAPTDASR
jgi:hypothetical protein